jgi:phosphoribosylaminoimidazole-succinocarboxamide synthase
MTQPPDPKTMPLNLLARGKVREVYEIDQERLLLVASDRISAFDVVMAEAIPHKGAVLTQISAFWFAQLDGVCTHHMISADIDQIIDLIPSLAPHRAGLAGRSMLCRRTKVFPIECVLRGYLSGSAWNEYRKTGTLAGESLAPGLVESAKLEPPIFSPATKAESGHDENITFTRMAEIIGSQFATQLETLTRAIYARGLNLALAKGIIIADTKFEFGQSPDGRILLIDEVMTPDSSRFWPADLYKPGGPQPSFDKQPVRDYLAQLRSQGVWNGDAPPPPLPETVVKATSQRYLDVYERLTGAALTR